MAEQTNCKKRVGNNVDVSLTFLLSRLYPNIAMVMADQTNYKVLTCGPDETMRVPCYLRSNKLNDQVRDLKSRKYRSEMPLANSPGFNDK
ncbi:hypothetical protein J6590_085613 [Homalodisca vitripennis]|nr:hypothetical protein J6590_085613 [Homalodisca vitripennis]